MTGLKDVVVSQGLAKSLCQSEKLKTDNIGVDSSLNFDITLVYK